MRLVAKLLYLAVLAICGLGIHGALTHPRVTPPVYPSVSFNLTGADTYEPFLRALQEKVILGNHTAFDLPVLNPESQVSDSNRFVLVPLTNPSGDTVTLAIDVVNLYVVAFSSNGKSYFFSGSTAVQRDNLFVDTTQEELNFTGNYTSLERQVGFGRVYIPLGPKSLDQAISSLRTYTLTAGDTKPLARGLLVVIQMVSEAARFRYIELRIRTSITDASEFTPDLLMLSMENNWSSMSSEIQQAQPGGIFAGVVQLRDERNNSIEVTNFRRLFELTYIAVLLYGCAPVTSSSYSNNAIDAQIIKMPVFRGGEYEKVCSVVEVTRRISGWDGLCVDVRYGHYIDGNPVQLRPCGNECNQLWTFRTDGTIRWLGKCLTASSSVMIYDCNTVPPEATKWVVSIDGTITNPHSGLVLTAPQAAEGTALSLENNIHAARQGWTVGDVEPLVTFIVGYKQMCLRENGENNFVWLEDCVLNRVQQEWALYGDGTIRVNSNRSLCVTSEDHEPSDLIVILKCEGSGNQRWVFNTNGTISNPNAKLLMDVAQRDVSLRKIILYRPTGNPNQQWITTTHPA
uniref:Ribosome-inactivating protein SNAI n=1 Tax=Sambucus nigra TaxID=4202 RepID=SNAIB_SAMNI|nr:RecName: Full=Ribosome-inactivating protein SNAI; AltName: Full=Agglutinin I; Contains: RecName: Full=SNAI-A chain; AltName: Full=rRNA N-glycosidase; Contains: RecName: Full=Linker peptide; Contains: RecName: Full=SNAI-B chain; Contains: RecName: Full=TrSNAI; Flags: Precursor [Sambucus nigra]AAC49158.1 lectin precursor [Sambucus nigra]prf//2206328A NeuAc-gal/GalNAc-binding lectin [Sambucus nigra]